MKAKAATAITATATMPKTSGVLPRFGDGGDDGCGGRGCFRDGLDINKSFYRARRFTLGLKGK
jgi:hypothetical protein